MAVIGEGGYGDVITRARVQSSTPLTDFLRINSFPHSYLLHFIKDESSFLYL